jgi:hypothetical protein
MRGTLIYNNFLSLSPDLASISPFTCTPMANNCWVYVRGTKILKSSEFEYIGSKWFLRVGIDGAQCCINAAFLLL